MKRQIWLEPAQIELIVDCLNLIKKELNESTLNSSAHKMAGKFVYRRIDEIIEMLSAPKGEQE